MTDNTILNVEINGVNKCLSLKDIKSCIKSNSAISKSETVIDYFSSNHTVKMGVSIKTPIDMTNDYIHYCISFELFDRDLYNNFYDTVVKYKDSLLREEQYFDI